MCPANAISKLWGNQELNTTIGAQVLNSLGREQFANGFTFAYKLVTAAIDQDLRGARASVVIRGERHAVGAGIENGEQFAFLYGRQIAVTGEEVSAFADRADDVNFVELVDARTEHDGRDLVVSAVKRGPH